MKAFVTDKVFRALQSSGPMSGVDLAKLMGRPDMSVQKCLSRLSDSGRALNLGAGRGSIWVAIDGVTDPFDGRGFHKNSLSTLFKYQKKNPRPIDIPRPWKATALEQAIGWGVEKH